MGIIVNTVNELPIINKVGLSLTEARGMKQPSGASKF